MENLNSEIATAIDKVVSFLEQNPDEARGEDSLASAELVEGLRCRAVAPDGSEVFSDMPSAVGGEGSAPTPGWLMKAGLATCDATVIAIRAAQLGVELRTLKVEVVSESDDRGLLGVDDSVPAGPLTVRTRIRIGADGVAQEKLREIVEWSDRHSPVGDAIRRSVPSEMEIEFV